MSEIWERGEHPGQAEVHEPVEPEERIASLENEFMELGGRGKRAQEIAEQIDRLKGESSGRDGDEIRPWQVWCNGADDMLDEKFLVILDIHHGRIDVVTIAPGNRVAGCVEHSIITEEELRSEFELFSE